jgi:hypothetical protein
VAVTAMVEGHDPAVLGQGVVGREPVQVGRGGPPVEEDDGGGVGPGPTGEIAVEGGPPPGQRDRSAGRERGDSDG